MKKYRVYVEARVLYATNVEAADIGDAMDRAEATPLAEMELISEDSENRSEMPRSGAELAYDAFHCGNTQWIVACPECSEFLEFKHEKDIIGYCPICTGEVVDA